MVSKPPLYVICHNIRSLYNVGAIFRTCDGAGVDKLFLGGYTGHPPRKEISKTALGAEEFLSWQHYKNTSLIIKRLREQKVNIIALEQDRRSIPYYNFKAVFPLALIIGNELRGLSKRMLSKADQVIEIPMLGQKNSLNVAVALGIVLYKIVEQRKSY